MSGNYLQYHSWKGKILDKNLHFPLLQKLEEKTHFTCGFRELEVPQRFDGVL